MGTTRRVQFLNLTTMKERERGLAGEGKNKTKKSFALKKKIDLSL